MSARSGEWQQQALRGWRDKHDVEPPKRCEQAKGTAVRRGVMERRPQRGTNRGRSGMVARSTDGHKTNASMEAEHLDGDGMERVCSLEFAVRS